MSWIIALLPDWICYALIAIGLVGIAATYLLQFFPFVNVYAIPIQLVSIGVVIIGVFMAGILINEQGWQDKIANLEKQVEELKVKSEKINTEITTKYITKQQIIREKGEEQIRYIDREITKYNDICPMPKEVMIVHNQATIPPKELAGAK